MKKTTTTVMARTILAVAALALSTAGCRKAQPPTFSPGSYTPNPGAYVNTTPVGASKILEPMKVSLAMSAADKKGLLYGGEAKLAVSTDGDLMLNLRHPGDMYRTPCNFWFRAPVQPSSWKVGTSAQFQILLEPGQFVVEENCGSRYTDAMPLVVTFPTASDGQRFMDLMTAMQARPPQTGVPHGPEAG